MLISEHNYNTLGQNNHKEHKRHEKPNVDTCGITLLFFCHFLLLSERDGVSERIVSEASFVETAVHRFFYKDVDPGIEWAADDVVICDRLAGADVEIRSVVVSSDIEDPSFDTQLCKEI